MIKIGTDICSIQRISDAYAHFGNRFLEKVLTDKETEYVLGQPQQTIHQLAGRFAAKEAALKALGTGWAGVHWKEIEVLKDALGAPILKLHGRALSLATQKDLTSWEVSLSHEKDHAIAFVLAYSS